MISRKGLREGEKRARKLFALWFRRDDPWGSVSTSEAQRFLGIYRKTRAFSYGSWPGNPRRSRGAERLTTQELRNNISFREQITDVVRGNWKACVLVIAMLVLAPLSEAADLTLYWTAVGDDSTSGTASAYELIYSTDSAAIAASNSGVAGFSTGPGVARYPDTLLTLPRVSGTPESLTVTGLAENEIYFFGIKARDDSLFALGYNIARGSTVVPDTIPPASIMDLRTSP